LQRVVPSLAGELVAIVEKAMARDLGRRYQRVAQLSEDLKRYQTGRLVHAFEYGLLGLLRRWIYRHRAILGILSLALVGALAFGVYSFGRIVEERNEARRQRENADAARAEAVHRANALLLSEANRVAAEDPVEAIRQLASMSDGNLDIESAWDIARKALAQGLPLATLQVGSAPLFATNSSGRYLAIVSRTRALVVESETLRVWQQWPMTVAPNDVVTDLRLLSDGTILVGLRSGSLWNYSFSAAPKVTHYDHGPIVDIEVSRDEAFVGVAFKDGSLLLHNRTTGKAAFVDKRPASITQLHFDDPMLYAGGDDGRITVLDTQKPLGQPRVVFQSESPVTCFALAKPGLVVGTDNGDVWLKESWSGAPRRLDSAASRILRVEWLTSSNHLLVMSGDFRVHLLSPIIGRTRREVGLGDSFAVSADGQWIAVAGVDGRVTIGASNAMWFGEVKAHGGPIAAIAFLGSGSLITLGSDGSLRLWSGNVHPDRLVRYRGATTRLDTRARSDRFLIASDAGELQLCGKTGACLTGDTGHAGRVVPRLAPVGGVSLAADFVTGDVFYFDDALAVVAILRLEVPLSDFRARGERTVYVTTRGSVLLSASMGEAPRPIDVCAHAVRLRWLTDTRILVSCTDGSLYDLDIADKSAHPQRIGGLFPPPLRGIGVLGRGGAIVLDASGTTAHASYGGLHLATCHEASSMLYEMLDKRAYVSECGRRALVYDEIVRRSPELVKSEIAALDGSAGRSSVAVGGADEISIWNYETNQLTTWAQTRLVYDIQWLPGEAECVVAASGIATAQLWCLEGRHSLPRDTKKFMKYLRLLASRYV
jgi:hypothetical protein